MESYSSLDTKEGHKQSVQLAHETLQARFSNSKCAERNHKTQLLIENNELKEETIKFSKLFAFMPENIEK